MDLFPLLKVLLWSASAFLLTMAITPAFTHVLYRWKLGKRIRSVEESPVFAALHQKKIGTPTMGGVLVWLTTLILCLAGAFWAWALPSEFDSSWSFLSRSQTYLPLAALVSAAILGLVDDLLNVFAIGAHGGGLRARHRLALYMLIAVVGSWWFYSKLGWSDLHVPFYGDIAMGWWYVPFFIFVIIATAFSVNETDGLDGLAGGVLLTNFAAFGLIAYIQGKTDLATFCGVLSGSLLAFLWFNIPPARFFMGDTGAMGMGVALGVVAFLTKSVLLLPITGIIFVMESVSVIIQVASKKIIHKKIFRSAPIHHHLEAIGWEEPKIVMRFWVISAVMTVLGVILAISDTTFIRIFSV